MKMQISRKIIELTKPYWPRVSAGILLGLINSGITAAIAWVVKPAMDNIFIGQNYYYMKFIPAGIAILFAIKGLVSFSQEYMMNSAGLKLTRDTRNRLYNHILFLPASHFSKESSGFIISRVINDVEMLRGLIATVITTCVMEVPTVILLLGVAFYRRWDLTLMTLLLVPLIAYSTRKFGKRVKKQRKEAQRKISSITHKIGEAISGIRIIKIFTREETMTDKFEKENQRYYREMLRVNRLKEFTKLAIDIMTGLGIAFAMWYGFTLVMKGAITAGDLTSILVAIYMLFTPLKKIGEGYTTLQETRASIERVDTILNAQHEEKGSMGIKGFSNKISFENVSFTYPGRESTVLKDINLDIRHGEVIAIVGSSGAGKSTLVDLIPKFYKPSAGAITIDGTDTGKVELRSLRELIGIVSQDVILFDDTIRENIAFGKKSATDADIAQAARLAHADDFIMELPQKYDTVVGERGLRLSGGQRQRLAIARAILKNPPILILDEATSSLDSVSESIVQKALDKLMKGRTTIVIAHRLSTIRNADRIVLLDKGEIADMGTHEELISRNDTYTKLYNTFALS